MVGLAACAGRSRAPLDDAQTEVGDARQNADVLAHAPGELDQAEAALARTEAAWNDGASGDTIDHLAYLTEQQVAIAEAIATERAAQDEIEALGETRDDVRLEAREAEIASLRERLEAEQTERGLVLTLPEDVYFDVDESTLKPGGRRELDRIAATLREYPERNVLIEGHTDSTGSVAYNRDLSARRAQAVRGYLVQVGVAPSRLIARGYGEMLPVASNQTAGGRQQNRRVELVILEPGVSDAPPTVVSPAPAAG